MTFSSQVRSSVILPRITQPGARGAGKKPWVRPHGEGRGYISTSSWGLRPHGAGAGAGAGASLREPGRGEGAREAPVPIRSLDQAPRTWPAPPGGRLAQSGPGPKTFADLQPRLLGASVSRGLLPGIARPPVHPWRRYDLHALTPLF